MRMQYIVSINFLLLLYMFSLLAIDGNLFRYLLIDIYLDIYLDINNLGRYLLVYIFLIVDSPHSKVNPIETNVTQCVE